MARSSSAKTRLRLLIEVVAIFTLTLGIPSALMVWNHHDLFGEGPATRSEAAAQAWLDQWRAGPGRACLSGESGRVQQIHDRSGYYARTRCRTITAYYRTAGALLAPCVFAALVILFFSRAPRRKGGKR